MGLSFTIAAGPRQRSHSQVESPGTRYHILLSQILDSLNLEAQIPVFTSISLRKRMAQLYSKALGILVY
jgi:hypothetical protein